MSEEKKVTEIGRLLVGDEHVMKRNQWIFQIAAAVFAADGCHIRASMKSQEESNPARTAVLAFEAVLHEVRRAAEEQD